jgi:hypothetical protein
VEASGPDHEKLFRIEVWIDDRPIGLGEGPSRRAAETAAALEALESIRRERAAGRSGGGAGVAARAAGSGHGGGSAPDSGP